MSEAAAVDTATKATKDPAPRRATKSSAKVADATEGGIEEVTSTAEGGTPAAPAQALQTRTNGRGPVSNADALAQATRREQRANVSRRRQAQEQALAYVPMKSHPAPLMTLTLSSEHSLSLFKKSYGFAHVAFYELVTVLPKKVKMADPDFDTAPLIRAIEDILVTRLDNLSGSLDLQKRQLVEVMKGNGGYPPFTAEEYSNATQVKLPLLTPHTKRMLGVLNQYDEIIRHVDRIWIETHMPDLEHDRAISNCRDEIVTAIRFFKRLHVLGGHLVRNMDQGKPVDIGMLLVQAGDDTRPDTVDQETEEAARRVSEEALGVASAAAA